MIKMVKTTKNERNHLGVVGFTECVLLVSVGHILNDNIERQYLSMS